MEGIDPGMADGWGKDAPKQQEVTQADVDQARRQNTLG